MKISVVVPAFNEEKLLRGTLTAIQAAGQAFDAAGWDWELIVCNNNSTDRTAEIAAEAGATVVFEPINQISRARNRGASVAKGEWLVFIDADSHPSAALFAATARRIASGRCSGGGCLVRMDQQSLFLGVAVIIWSMLSWTMRWAAGSFIFCRADLFQEVGGFSDQMYASEELDLSDKLKKAGKKQNLRFQIITEEKLVTSARKLQLYGRRTHLKFFLKAMFRPRSTVRNREQCVLWYDGRR